MKYILGLISLFIIALCLMALSILLGFPNFIETLIQNFNSTIQVDSTKFIAAILILCLVFPFLFLSQAAKIHNKQEEEIQRLKKEQEDIRNQKDFEIKKLQEIIEKKSKGVYLWGLEKIVNLGELVIENKDNKGWEKCRIKIKTFDGQEYDRGLSWYDSYGSTGNFEKDCKVTDKLSVLLGNQSNQRILRELKGLNVGDEKSLVGVHNMELLFIANRVNENTISKSIRIEFEVLEKYEYNEYGTRNQTRLLKIEEGQAE